MLHSSVDEECVVFFCFVIVINNCCSVVKDIGVCVCVCKGSAAKLAKDGKGNVMGGQRASH